tara:strand:- start:78 stop:311 length:234 start_codon:yes stop_codon:yes gene_type:complete
LYAHVAKSLQGPSLTTQSTEKNIIIGLYVWIIMRQTIMRHDTYIPPCFQVEFVKFKELYGKNTSRQICNLIRESLKQ